MTSRFLFHGRWVAVLLILVDCGDFHRGPAPDASTDVAPVPVGDGGAGAFAARVAPVLLANCDRCHHTGGSASKSRFVLTGDTMTDRMALLPLVSPANPAASALLVAALGQGHGGGAILRTDAAEYRTLIDWISQGAQP